MSEWRSNRTHQWQQTLSKLSNRRVHNFTGSFESHTNTYSFLFNRSPFLEWLHKRSVKQNLDVSGIIWPYANICTVLHTENQASTQSLNFLQAGCSTWDPTNSVKALKAILDPQTAKECHTLHVGTPMPIHLHHMLAELKSYNALVIIIC